MLIRLELCGWRIYYVVAAAAWQHWGVVNAIDMEDQSFLFWVLEARSVQQYMSQSTVQLPNQAGLNWYYLLTPHDIPIHPSAQNQH
jgi:hypothetical protein